jgi:hypothetical protein
MVPTSVGPEFSTTRAAAAQTRSFSGRSKESKPEDSSRPPALEGEVASELKRILKSEFFRGAKRCRDFLEYVVETTCAGGSEQLKERTIGIEIFGRDASYDTGDDAIVRVKANEVRRRLAQYELSADPHRPVRIMLPAGSYVPQFIRTSSELPAIEDASGELLKPDPPADQIAQGEQRDVRHQRRFTLKMLISLSVIVLAVAFCIFKVAVPAPSKALKTFWNPLIEGQGPLLICIGYPTVYLPIKGESEASIQVNNSFDTLVGRSSLPESPTKLDVVGVSHAFVAIGDSDAGFLIGRALQSLGRSSQIRMGSDISFSDLKSNRVVLLGAYSNKWTLLMTSDLRFSFAELNRRRMIVDHNVPGKFWADPALSATGKTSEDYALVSRAFSPKSDRVVISVAGISQYGTQAAAEFITDPASVKKVLELAPKGWKGTNLQVVLKSAIVGETPEDAEIVATHFW